MSVPPLILTVSLLVAPDSIGRSALDSIARRVAILAPPWIEVAVARDSLAAHGFDCSTRIEVYRPTPPDTMAGPLCSFEQDSRVWRVGLLSKRGRLAGLEVCGPAGSPRVGMSCASYSSPVGRGPVPPVGLAVVGALTALLAAAIIAVSRGPGVPAPLPANLKHPLDPSVPDAGAPLPRRATLLDRFQTRRHLSHLRSAIRWAGVRQRGRRAFVIGWMLQWGLPMFAATGITGVLTERTSLSAARFTLLMLCGLLVCLLGGLAVGWLNWALSERNLRRVVEGQPRSSTGAA